jgi:hypothetical protein
MVVYRPLPPLPVTPDTPYDYLNRRIDGMSEQLAEIMHHFCTLTATPSATASGTYSHSTPGTYVAAAPIVSPITLPPRPVLVPTPDVQGPPPAVTEFTAELIGDHHLVIRLTYNSRSHTLRSQAHNL